MTGKRPTLQDIAASLNVSVNTVSRALNNKSGVGRETRERIHAEAERIGYVPNAYARSLVLGSRMLIGLVITNASNPFYAGLISEVEKYASEAGYSVILLSSDESMEREEEAADGVLRSGIDGAIVVPVQGKRHPWLRVQKAGVPIVVVNRQLPDLSADLVRTDNYAGMYAATRHAIDQGARNLVLYEEDLPILTIQHRIDGYRAAKADAGIEPTDNSVVYVPARRSGNAILPWHADEAHRTTVDLLDRGHLPDAIITGNDYFALGAMRALHQRGIEVPGRTLVIGYGDYPFSAHLTPPLTSVRLPTKAVGQRAVELLLRRIRGGEPVELEHHTLRPEVVVRESSRQSPGLLIAPSAGAQIGGPALDEDRGQQA